MHHDSPAKAIPANLCCEHNSIHLISQTLLLLIFHSEKLTYLSFQECLVRVPITYYMYMLPIVSWTLCGLDFVDLAPFCSFYVMISA